jgi:hypothetical protein
MILNAVGDVATTDEGSNACACALPAKLFGWSVWVSFLMAIVISNRLMAQHNEGAHRGIELDGDDVGGRRPGRGRPMSPYYWAGFELSRDWR